ncbi:DNA-processing protein DprA [Echinicola shivajiensis]|uniref:DNA-processing protein DprA n=1 Tax=Echinicola shivajiensis TaxID=1035916 RepID=UPI001BFC7772|nr:DNA-processing protein DprA [Echinicola shivajiensis]
MQKTTDETKLLYSIALSLIPQLGPNIYKTIISYCGTAENFFNLTRGKAAKIPGIGPKLLEIRKQKLQFLQKAEKVLEDCLKHQINIHTYLDPNYPSRLKSYLDSPVLLFTKGNINLNPERTIGIVGTRNASDYGKLTTRKIVESLSTFQPTVISGLAYGIDITAHRAALDFGLPTISVLGNSLESIYPASHKSTALNMMENGGLVSEYKVGTTLNANNFPARNRIIAALSDALIVVEAAKRGGALITAEIAYSYNREVFAVPGNLQNTYSEGCNNLIRSMKASIYTGPKDIQEALSWDKENKNPSYQKNKPKLELEQFSPTEQIIIKLLLEEKTLEIDQLSWQSQIPVSQLASLLLNLEFQGLVKSFPGKKYGLC